MRKLVLVLWLGIGLNIYGCGDDNDDVTCPTGDTGDTSSTEGDAGPSTLETCPGSAYCIDGEEVQPTIGVRSASVITVDEREFKDSNGNGELDPYEDWRLSPAARADDLVTKMTTDQMIGLLTEGGMNVAPETEDGALSEAETKALTDDFVRQSLLVQWPAEISAAGVARHMNNLQELAESLPLGVPMVITTDPIFGAASNMESTELSHRNMSPQIIDWPLVLGLGAINDEDYVKEIAAMQAAQLRALGLRWMLGPQIDLATEPMWSRVYDTFGSQPDRVAALGKAYIQGFQGKDDGVNPFSGVAACLKHFPGGGSNEGGMDSHSEVGRFAVFPGDSFAVHVNVMQTVIEGANPISLMPCYSIFEDVMWRGSPVEQMGSAYSNVLLNDLLRGEIGWDGLVTSDWSAIGVCLAPGNCISLLGWGTENWSNAERVATFVENGGHQIGLWMDSRLMWEDALDEETIADEDVAHAAKKVLELAFNVGAFEDPYVDPDEAATTIDSYADEAHDAMMRAFTLLKNNEFILPLDADSADQNEVANIQIYFDGHDDTAVDTYVDAVPGFEAVTDIADADYAIIRLSARWGIYSGLDGGVPLSYRDPIRIYSQEIDGPSPENSTGSSMDGSAAENNAAGNAIADVIEAAIAAKTTNPNLKIILAVSMFRPFIIADYLDDIDVLAAEFGMTDEALLDMLFQMRHGTPDSSIQPTGTLPMEIPSSQAAVYDAKEDVPHDSVDPTFEVGAGFMAYDEVDVTRYTVYLDDVITNGAVVTDPPLTTDGTLVAKDTVITVTPEPDDGYVLDSVYQAVPGPFTAFDGVLYYTNDMVAPYEIKVTQDEMTVGAYFVEESVVAGVETTHDIVYAEPGVKPLKYDVFEPEASHTDLPCVVIIHGGGWMANNEDIMRGLARELAKTEKYVAFSIDYRWASYGDGDPTPNSMADLINDVFGAIYDIMQNATTYGADPAKIAVTGDSSGGHLAAVVATLSDKIGTGGFGVEDGVWEFWPTGVAEEDVAGFKTDLQAAVLAVEPCYGAFANLDDYIDGEEWNEHVSPQSNIPDLNADPSARVLPPQHLTRGSTDFLVTEQMVQDYADALEAAGQAVSIYIVEGASHAYLDWKPHAQTIDTFNSYGMEGIDDMVEFFDGVFYP